MKRPSALRITLGLGLPIAVAAFGVWKLRLFQRRAEQRIVEELTLAPLPVTAEIPLALEKARAKVDPLTSFEQPGAARASAAPALAGTALALEGTVLALDGEGRELAAQDGGFEIEVQLHDRGAAWSETRAIAVKAGRWSSSFVLPRAAETSDLRWSARDLVLGQGRLRSPLLSDGLDEIDRRFHPVPENGVLALRGRPVSRARVAVVAKDTRAPLSELEVRALPGSETALDLDHPLARLLEPGAQTVAHLLAHTSSPIEIEGVGRALYWIRAPGYAWGRIAIDHDRPVPRTLVLERAGELVVRLESWRTEWNVRLRVHRRTPNGVGALVAQRNPASSSVTRIDGLGPGSYELRAEVGRAFEGERPIVLRSAPVDLRARESSEVTLAIGRPPQPVPAPFAGTLAWPHAWHAVEAELVIVPWGAEPVRPGWIFKSAVAKLAWRTGDDQALSWNAGDAGPGRYLAEIRPLRMFELVDVGPRGSIFNSIEVPRDWSGVRIQLARVGSAEKTPVRWLVWQRVEGELAGVAPFTSLAPRTSDVFFLSAPPGEVRVTAVNREHRYVLEPGVVTSRSGGAEAALDVLPCCRARLVLREKGEVVPADPLWLSSVEFRRVGGGQAGEPLAFPFEITRADVDPGFFDPVGVAERPPHTLDGARAPVQPAALYDVTAPGEYEVRLAPIAGFKAFEPRRVMLAREAAVEIFVDLVPEK